MLGSYAFSARPISSIGDGQFEVTGGTTFAKVPEDSALFASDQVFSCTVDTWNTPFTPLESNVASAGLVLNVRQPTDTKTWTKTYLANLKGGSATTVNTRFAQFSAVAVSNGRVPNVYESWGAGAPAWYGAQHAGQVALHYSAQLRPVTGRSWFSADSTVTCSLALAGSGYVRITKTVGGTTSEVLVAGQAGYQFTEQDFLENGLQFTEVLNLSAGDQLDIYYVQAGEAIGGLVAKVVEGVTQTQELAQAAPVLGCGLFDDGAPPDRFSLPNLGRVQVQHAEGNAFRAVIELPLINPALHDGFGYEFVQSEADLDDQYIKVWDGGAVQYNLRKGRLIRVSMSEPTAPYIVFTGVIKDFGTAQNGVLSIECLSFEHRLLETHTKNEPDEASYMCFGYRRLTTTGEPVYGIQAYDNWAMEHVIGDLMYHGGIDASRLNAVLWVSKSDGSSTQVQYGGETFSTFRARNVKGKPLRLERPVHYGNVGDAFTDIKPVDDGYKFPPENMRELWYRARDITDRYGYDLRFNSMGDVVLSTRANPAWAYDFAVSNAGGVATLKTHPSAFGGTYIELSAAQAPTVTINVTGARLDVSLPRGANLGAWADVRITRASDGREMARVQNLDPALDGSDVFYYDYRSSPSGDNATLYTVFSGDYDEYVITMRPTGTGLPDGKARRLDTVFVYHTDPVKSRYPQALGTSGNALQVEPSGSSDDQRNLVYVVGSRKTTATDSEKLKTNPNNPDPEFIVSVAVDVDSIVNPGATNYIGLKREALIVDPAVTDQDYADYLSRTAIYRYRIAKPPVAIKHTLLPVIEVRDPVTAEETQFGTVTDRRTLWVIGYTHTFARDGYTTDIQTSAFPEFPSYEVRSDVDIDTTFGGLPITNVEVTYTSLTGQEQTNLPTGGIVHASDDSDIVSVSGIAVHAGSPEYLDLSGHPWPPVPGTVFLTPGSGGQSSSVLHAPAGVAPSSPALLTQLASLRPGQTWSVGTLTNVVGITSVVLTSWRALPVSPPLPETAGKNSQEVLTNNAKASSRFYYELDSTTHELRIHYKTGTLDATTAVYFTADVTYVQDSQGALTNTPYHHLMNVDYRTSNPKIYLPWVQGDGLPGYRRNEGVADYSVQYRRLGPGAGAFTDPYAGVSPFYDPTTSQLGELVRFKFDALVSGLYRVSVRSVDEPDVVVAYLTEPTADPSLPESHWQYLTAGADKEFYWDGVDQLGEWNLEQSAEVAALSAGAFESADAQLIGAGWYAWNRELVHGAYGPLALISGDLDASGKPVFGQGTYSAWFFQVECQNDDLADIAEQHKTDPNAQYQIPRIAKTNDAEPGRAAPIYTTEASAAVVYMHLPEPTGADLLVDDWVAGFAYDANNSAHATTEANWGAASADATISTTKPVRLRMQVRPRPGILWSEQQGEVDVKLTRHVHPRVYFFDQVLVSEGTQYASDAKTLTAVEKRTLYTRRFENNAHTTEFVDSGYRKAKTFYNPAYPTGTAVWVFTPDLLKKNYRGIENEPLKFMDYLQLEELPNWNPNTGLGAARSRYLLGFMAYLFYLSAYVQDRSGRRVWCVNRSFLDTSKLVTNSYSDWWAPGAPGTAATASTFQLELAPDLTRMFQRSIVCRQWTDESTWIADQTAQWNLAGGVGEKLLKHKWSDHEPTSTTLNGAAWPVLTRDDHSHWHTDAGRTQLPTQFHSMTRQLGAWAASATSSALGNWSWEFENSIAWAPCVTRDWHPYFFAPPMADGTYSANYPGVYIYGTGDGQSYNSTKNTGDDVAKFSVWQSWVRDISESYSSSASGTKRFTPGSAVDPNTAPNHPPPANVLNYVRQDELTHYEALRGVFTRGPRPAEGPKKLTPEAPYYSNPMRYAGLIQSLAKNQAGIPMTYATTFGVLGTTDTWFRMAFRSEYLWESGTFFPVTKQNQEYAAAYNMAKTRFGRLLQNAVAYDAGAWVGWKDDIPAAFGSVLAGGDDLFAGSFDAFSGKWMPLAVGPELTTTKDLYFHMVLLNERRDTPV